MSTTRDDADKGMPTLTDEQVLILKIGNTPGNKDNLFKTLEYLEKHPEWFKDKKIQGYSLNPVNRSLKSDKISITSELIRNAKLVVGQNAELKSYEMLTVTEFLNFLVREAYILNPSRPETAPTKTAPTKTAPTKTAREKVLAPETAPTKDVFVALQSSEENVLNVLKASNKKRYLNEYTSHIERASEQLTDYVMLKISRLDDASEGKEVNKNLQSLQDSISDYVSNDIMQIILNDSPRKSALAVTRWLNIASECTKRGDMFTGIAIYNSLFGPPLNNFEIAKEACNQNAASQFIESYYDSRNNADTYTRAKCMLTPPAIPALPSLIAKMTKSESDKIALENLKAEMRIYILQAKILAANIKPSPLHQEIDAFTLNDTAAQNTTIKISKADNNTLSKLGATIKDKNNEYKNFNEAGQIGKLFSKNKVEEKDQNLKEYITSRAANSDLLLNQELHFESMISRAANELDDKKKKEELLDLYGRIKRAGSYQEKINILNLGMKQFSNIKGSFIGMLEKDEHGKDITKGAYEVDNLLDHISRAYKNGIDADNTMKQSMKKGLIVSGISALLDIQAVQYTLTTASLYVNQKNNIVNLTALEKELKRKINKTDLDSYFAQKNQIDELRKKISPDTLDNFDRLNADIKLLEHRIDLTETEIPTITDEKVSAEKKQANLKNKEILNDNVRKRNELLKNDSISKLDQLQKDLMLVMKNDDVVKLHECLLGIDASSKAAEKAANYLTQSGLDVSKINTGKSLDEFNQACKELTEILKKASTTTEDAASLLEKLNRLKENQSLNFLKEIKINGVNAFEKVSIKILELDVEKKRIHENSCAVNMKACVRNKERISLEAYINKSQEKIDNIKKSQRDNVDNKKTGVHENKVNALKELMLFMDKPDLNHAEKIKHINNVLDSGVLGKRTLSGKSDFHGKNTLKRMIGKKTLATKRLLAYKTALEEKAMLENHEAIVKNAASSQQQLEQAKQALHDETEKIKVVANPLPVKPEKVDQQPAKPLPIITGITNLDAIRNADSIVRLGRLLDGVIKQSDKILEKLKTSKVDDPLGINIDIIMEEKIIRDTLDQLRALKDTLSGPVISVKPNELSKQINTLFDQVKNVDKVNRIRLEKTDNDTEKEGVEDSSGNGHSLNK